MNSLSVVIPTRGRAGLALRAVESVFRQTAPPAEVLVVCNPDPDPDVLEWSPRFGPTLRVLHSPREGAASARNAGIEAATGDWVGFLDDDDEWRPDKWLRQLEWARRFPNAVALFSGAWIEDESGERARTVWTRQAPAAGDIRVLLAADNFIPTSSMTVRRDVLLAEEGFQPSSEPAEDYDLWLRVARRGTVVFDPEPTVIYHAHAGQIGARLGPMYAACASVLRGFSTVETHARAARVARRRAFELTLASAEAHRREGCLEQAVAQARQALSEKPWNARALWKCIRICWIKAYCSIS